MTTFSGLLLDDTTAEKLRLILSTFQDGFGQLDLPNTDTTLPGWRDFERATAVALGGKGSENKAIFDVLVALPDDIGHCFGVSCKMRNTLDKTRKNGRVYMELSNSNGQFWNEVELHGMDKLSFRQYPEAVGKAILERVRKWYDAVSHRNSGRVVLDKSFFLTLSYNKAGTYQLHQFVHTLPEASELEWVFPVSQKGTSKRIVGFDSTGPLFEWYFDSGGQLKYYPLVSNCLWSSSTFRLEPLKFPPNVKAALESKAESYFPSLWNAVNGNKGSDIFHDSVP